MQAVIEAFRWSLLRQRLVFGKMRGSNSLIAGKGAVGRTAYPEETPAGVSVGGWYLLLPKDLKESRKTERREEREVSRAPAEIHREEVSKPGPRRDLSVTAVTEAAAAVAAAAAAAVAVCYLSEAVQED